MNGIENQLKRSLQRKGAPGGFADRILEQLDDTTVQRRRRGRWTRRLSGIAAALMLGTIGTGVWMQHQQSVRERIEAEQASALVKLALHIASEKTNIARTRLTGVDPDAGKDKEGTNEEITNE